MLGSRAVAAGAATLDGMLGDGSEGMGERVLGKMRRFFGQGGTQSSGGSH